MPVLKIELYRPNTCLNQNVKIPPLPYLRGVGANYVLTSMRQFLYPYFEKRHIVSGLFVRSFVMLSGA